MKRVCLFTTPFPFMQAINSGIAACSKRVGPWRIEVQFFSTAELICDFLSSQHYDGVILTYDAPFAPEIIKHGITVVGALVDNYPIPHAKLDERAVGAMGAQHLLECGYRQFAYFDSREPWSRLRYEGFRDLLRTHGYTPFSNVLPPPGQSSHLDNYIQTDSPEDFVRRLQRPVAVMACNDASGRRIADSAIEHGMRVPGDLAVIGVDNDEICCETGACPLTSIDTDLYRVGFEAALMLDRLMRGSDQKAANCLVKPREVVRRQSTSMFAHEDPDIASALRFIYEHACEGITVNDVCEHIALSRRRFEQRFFNAVGHSPGHQIRNIRAERAKSLLKETNMTLSEISVRCGYAYISGFASAFRSIVGMSPGAYRKKHEAFTTESKGESKTEPRPDSRPESKSKAATP
jgi:LacI family transcriptional regulator